MSRSSRPRHAGMAVLDLFSAASGGWSLGMHRAGFTTVAACEIEAWRRALYAEG
jgi:DNA (cytosine-5)-methyltransferase 1